MTYEYPEEKCKNCPLCGEFLPDFWFADMDNPEQHHPICQTCWLKEEYTDEEMDRLKQISFTNFLMVARAIEESADIIEEKKREKEKEENHSDNNT